MKSIIKKEKKIFRLIALLLAFTLAFTCIQFPAKAEESTAPVIGNAANAADTMVILNNGKVTRETPINMTASTRATFENLAFGDTGVWYYSAKVSVNESEKTSQQVNMTLGYVTDANNIKRYIDVCARYLSDSQKWDCVVWARTATNEAQWFKSVGSISVAEDMASYQYTMKYDNGKITFWLNDTALTTNFDVINGVLDNGLTFSDFNAEPGIWTRSTAATISDIAIWGDVAEASVTDEMLVKNNNTDVTASYITNKQIEMTSFNRVIMENLTVGENKSFWVSADVKATISSGQFVSVVLGHGIDGNGEKRYIEMFHRRSDNDKKWQSGIFLRSADDLYDCPWTTGDSFWPTTNISYDNMPINEGNDTTKSTALDCRYTVKYEDGCITFWIDGTQVMKTSDLATAGISNNSGNLTNITIEPGFYAYNATEVKISNVDIWGDVQADNAAYGMSVWDANGAEYTKEYEASVRKHYGTDAIMESGEFTITGSSDTRRIFKEVSFGDTGVWYYSANVSVPESAATSQQVNITVGYVTHGTERRYIDVSGRYSASGWDAVVWARIGDSAAWFKYPSEQKTTPANGTNYRYTVKCDNGKITFWLNDVKLLDDYDVLNRQTSADVTPSNFVPEPGFYSKNSAATISDIALYGDVTATRTFGEAEPKIDDAANAAYGMTVIGAQRKDYTREYEATVETDTEGAIKNDTGSIALEEGDRRIFQSLEFDDTDPYYYSANIYETSDSGYVSMVLGYGYDTTANQNKRYIEICVRPSSETNWQMVIFLRGTEAGVPWAVGSSKLIAIPEDVTDYRYTAKYDKGKVSFWLNNTRILYEFDLNGVAIQNSEGSYGTLSNIVLETGLYANGLSATISDIDLWNGVTATRTFGSVLDSDLLGDCNGDLVIDVKDLVRMKRGIAGKAEVNNQGNIKAEVEPVMDDNDVKSLRKIIVSAQDNILQPIWEGGMVYDETVMPLENKDGTLDKISLLYHADEIISIRSTDLKTVYIEGVDYKLVDGDLEILTTGSIPVTQYNEYYLTKAVDGGSVVCNNDTDAYLKYSEGGYFHMRQIVVTYTHSDAFGGTVPAKQGTAISSVLDKMKNKQNINVVFYGDSITAGASVSNTIGIGIAPYLDRWSEIVVKELQKTYGYEGINYINTAHPGENSNWGVTNVEERVKNQNPDLLVLAFGMNDGTLHDHNNVSPEQYGNNIRRMIDSARSVNANCSIILVATTLPNSEADNYFGHQKDYLKVLKTIANEYENIALADMTSMHQHLLTQKSFRDMTGNNINHPNDYLVRVYAQVILETLSEE